MAAFDLASGDELWTAELGPRYVGHDGSTDGPLSTPTVVDATVYAVGARGELVALDAETGDRRWFFEFNEGNSNVPFYGYTSSPVIHGNTLFLATGGEGKALTALDRLTGQIKWTAGSDSVLYQTPTVMTLGGRNTVILASNQWLHAFDAATGDELWTLQHTEGNDNQESAHVTPVGTDTFLVNYQNGATLYRADAGSVAEVWQTRALANTLVLPVVVGDSVFGFNRGILTSLDAQTGEIQWRSRAPGGQGLTRVGDRLAIISGDGALVLADATSSGYREITRIDTFDAVSTHAPSFANGSFLVRNLAELVSIRVDADAQPSATPEQTTERLRGSFGEWITEVERRSVARRQAAIDRRFSDDWTSPVFEDSGDRSLAHFIWRGDAENVGLSGGVVANQATDLDRVEGTDLFFKTLELVPAAQYDYTLSVDYGPPQADSNNPHSIDQGFTVVSEVRMPDWPAAPHLEEPASDAARGTLDSFPFRSLALGNTRQIQVWRPPGYGADPATSYPLVIVNHGDNQVRGSLMPNTLDNLVGQSVAPVIAVFVPRAAGPEYGGSDAETYTRFVVEELIPHLHRHYRVADGGHAVMGPGSAGVAALDMALAHPDLFPKVATQSYYPIEPATGRSHALLEGDGPKPERAYVVYSLRDYPESLGGDAMKASRELLEKLRATNMQVDELVTQYSPGWGGWRGQHDDILQAFFPLNQEP